MSAYAHQMEREFSGLSSRGNSEMGSRFSIESGCYMTSLAATIFIASLVTFGVLMLSLLVAISTMLQNCENQKSGLVEVPRFDDESFSYCKILSLHSQLNSIELPLLCRDVASRRIKQGIYLRELNFTIQMALSYFQTIKPMKDNLDVVVIDIDETNLLEEDSYIEEAKQQKRKLTLELYSKLRSQGYSMFLLSRRHERERNATTEELKSSGYSGWSRLIMREDATRQKEELEGENRVIGVIGNHMDVLTGKWNWQSKRLFKLPSLNYNDDFGLQ
uniref:Acid phosphatase 1 n=1 Tax=Noccaea caerulescens TaxID=107243 RepID=A0A1J3HEQ4_NOCCA